MRENLFDEKKSLKTVRWFACVKSFRKLSFDHNQCFVFVSVYGVDNSQLMRNVWTKRKHRFANFRKLVTILEKEEVSSVVIIVDYFRFELVSSFFLMRLLVLTSKQFDVYCFDPVVLCVKLEKKFVCCNEMYRSSFVVIMKIWIFIPSFLLIKI